MACRGGGGRAPGAKAGGARGPHVPPTFATGGTIDPDTDVNAMLTGSDSALTRLQGPIRELLGYRRGSDHKGVLFVTGPPGSGKSVCTAVVLERELRSWLSGRDKEPRELRDTRVVVANPIRLAVRTLAAYFAEIEGSLMRARLMGSGIEPVACWTILNMPDPQYDEQSAIFMCPGGSDEAALQNDPDQTDSY